MTKDNEGLGIYEKENIASIYLKKINFKTSINLYQKIFSVHKSSQLSY
jgi:hypothetical protein